MLELHSRRDFLKFALALGGAAVLGGNAGVASAEVTRSFAQLEAEPGRFYPDGAGLRELFNKFNAAHERLTGENNIDAIDIWIKRFERTNNPAEGLCNGLANANIIKTDYYPESAYLGDVLFKKDEIMGLVSALHIGDSNKSERFTLAGKTRSFRDDERAEPIFLDAMVNYHLRQRSEGICVNFSPYPDQMWARMVDQATHTYTNIGGGWVGVDLTLRTNGYIERAERFHTFRMGYEINTRDVYEPGRYVHGDPLQSIWFPDQNSQKSEYNIRDSIFTSSSIASLEKLTGFPV